ncbi:MAG: hypothetical protein NC819_01900 [Candidatus Omnitrophica bacterium]|nr:hypothetical protein [Candidatus Omnitrophota bacterium]
MAGGGSATPGKKQKLEIAVGDAVSYGADGAKGIVEAIRIIDSAKFVPSFSGEGEEVVLTIRDGAVTTNLWVKDGIVIVKLDKDQQQRYRDAARKSSRG